MNTTMIPVTTEYTSANENYRARRAEIDTLMVDLRDKLAALDSEQAHNSRDWGYAGDAARMVELLREVVR